MTLRLVIATLLAGLSAGPALAQYQRGVNLAGAEFGDNRIPGVFDNDYTVRPR